jgi:hypothetical protein
LSVLAFFSFMLFHASSPMRFLTWSSNR